jgi:predicted HAD superfamily hydrolase
MYIEDEYIQNQFNKNFLMPDFSDIVIYGTGIHTQKLLENISDERIVGLMDAKRTGEVLWGKKVLSYDEVAALPKVSIVIIARNAVINVIYRRIEAFVKENEIKVFDIRGNCLGQTGNDEIQDCFLLNKNELLTKIEAADVVSFDIFDTLLCRRVLRPTDIFQVMDKQLKDESYVFSKERIRAESEMPDGSNPDIHQIYERLQENLNLSGEKTQALMRLEIETEINFLKRRDEMCDILEFAADMGKRILIVSDMYMTQEILRDILSHFGIFRYEKLYVSCEYKTSKSERLFETVGEELDPNFEKWLHIGDNVYTDIIPAEKLNIDTFQVYSTVELLERSIYSKLLEHNDSLEENIVISYFAAEAFNNPFGMSYGLYGGNGKLRIDSIEKLAELIVAPISFKYVCWLIGRVMCEGIETVVFPSRDGFILKRIYDIIAESRVDLKLPKAVYLYTSRRAAMVAAADKKKDIDEIVDIQNVKSKYDQIVEGFDMDEAEVKRVMSGCDSLNDFELPVEFLLEKCAAEKENYLRYVMEELNEGRKIALVDFVSMGTVQRSLQKLLNMEIRGFYFLHRFPDAEEKKINCESLYKVSGDFENNSNLYKYYYFLETVFSSYEPTFKKINKDGGKEFFEEKRNGEFIDKLKKMHQEIIKYSDDMNKLIPDIIGLEAGVGVYDEFIGFISADYVDIENNVLDGFVNYDEFMGKVVSEMNR